LVTLFNYPSLAINLGRVNFNNQTNNDMIYILSVVAVFSFWSLCFFLGRIADGPITGKESQFDYLVKRTMQGFWMVFVVLIIPGAFFFLFFHLFN